MPSSTASCTPLTASHSTGRPCVNQRKKPASGASLTPTTSSELLKPSTGELSAIIGMLSAIDRNQCPQSIGTPVRNPRNPHSIEPTHQHSPRHVLEQHQIVPSRKQRPHVLSLLVLAVLKHPYIPLWPLNCLAQRRATQSPHDIINGEQSCPFQ